MAAPTSGSFTPATFVSLDSLKLDPPKPHSLENRPLPMSRAEMEERGIEEALRRDHSRNQSRRTRVLQQFFRGAPVRCVPSEGAH